MENWSDDIYFDENYGKANEELELGQSVHYILENSNGKIISTFIKRRIPVYGLDEDWYDIRTPYGYGGPLVVEASNKEKLIEDYNVDFASFCRSNNIATEFVRFHPIAQNAIDFKRIYDVFLDRKTVGTNIKISDNPIDIEFSKKCRKNIRRALNKGLTYSIVEQPDSLEEFKNIYYETMNRNDASDFYYFGDDYFSNLIKFFKEKLLVIYIKIENKIIAAGLYFVSHNIVHIHLSGTLDEYLSLNPPYVLRYAIAEWAIEHEINYLHHGGGRTTDPDDSLYAFKKQFGQNTSFDFYIGEKIWNRDVYEFISKQMLPKERVNDYIRRIHT